MSFSTTTWSDPSGAHRARSLRTPRVWAGSRRPLPFLVASVITGSLGCASATTPVGTSDTNGSVQGQANGASATEGGGGAVVLATGDFSLRDTRGKTIRLSDYLGKKVILLNFWATWCIPCAAELPHLQRLYAELEDEGLVILGISMDGPESVANVGSWVRRYSLSFPVLLDEETRVVGKYNPKRAAPFNVLFGLDGSVVKTREGFTAGDEAEIEADVRALLRSVR